MLPPVPPGIVPHIAAWSEERTLNPQLVLSRRRPGLGYADETPHDRDSFGQLWVRPMLKPKRRRGVPRPHLVHPYRQRRAMLDMLCQVCNTAPPNPDGPHFFVLRNAGGPVREGERTTSPPVCVPCAAIATQLCPELRGQWTAAWVGQVSAWGVAGVVHHPGTTVPQRPILQRVEYDTPLSPWTVAHRLVGQLVDVRSANLGHDLARLGSDRLEAEFARVAGLVGTSR